MSKVLNAQTHGCPNFWSPLYIFKPTLFRSIDPSCVALYMMKYVPTERLFSLSVRYRNPQAETELSFGVGILAECSRLLCDSTLPVGSAWDGGSGCRGVSIDSSSPFPAEAAYSGGTSRHHLERAGISQKEAVFTFRQEESALMLLSNWSSFANALFARCYLKRFL